MNSLRHRDVRETGSERLCCQAIEQSGAGSFLSGRVDRYPEDVRLVLTRIISRAVYPAPELKTGRRIGENPAIGELTGFPADKIAKDRLCRISRRLYSLEESLETFLSYRTGELFDIEDKIIPVDLTDTCFGGVKRSSRPFRPE